MFKIVALPLRGAGWLQSFRVEPAQRGDACGALPAVSLKLKKRITYLTFRSLGLPPINDAVFLEVIW